MTQRGSSGWLQMMSFSQSLYSVDTHSATYRLWLFAILRLWLGSITGVGVPEAGVWKEVFNTDSREFSGSGVINELPLVTEPLPMHHQLHSLVMTLPPLATLYLHLVP